MGKEGGEEQGERRGKGDVKKLLFKLQGLSQCAGQCCVCVFEVGCRGKEG